MMKGLLGGVALAAAMLAVAWLSRYAQAAHLLAPDAAARGSQVVIGLMLAAYANFMPKRVGPALMQSVLRVGGWVYALAGLVYALAWAVLPLSLAWQVGVAAVGTALAVSIFYVVWACATRARLTH
jgi:hypothetical protein